MTIRMSMILHLARMLLIGKAIQATLLIASQPPHCYIGAEYQESVHYMTTDDTFKPICNWSNPLHEDVVIKDFAEERIIFEDDLSRKSREKSRQMSGQDFDSFRNSINAPVPNSYA